LAITSKKIGLYAVTGVAIAVIVIASIYALGVQLPGSGKGTLVVQIKDKPAELSNLYVTISDLYVHKADEDSWINLGLTEEAQGFDLLTLRDKTMDLSETEITPGLYDKVRLTVSEASCVFLAAPEATPNPEATPIPLTVPPGHIDVIINIQITEGDTTQVVIDMQPDSVAISTSLNLKPVLKAEVVQVTPPPSVSPPPSA